MSDLNWNLMTPEELAQTILDIVDIKISEAHPTPAHALEVDYKAMLERIVMLVNPVTSAHRHGMSIMDRVSRKHLDDLCNYQIECDAALTGEKERKRK